MYKAIEKLKVLPISVSKILKEKDLQNVLLNIALSLSQATDYPIQISKFLPISKN